ncbi:TAT-variant-translocated molybdopterin oxidoreductase [soil metagenome]
MDRPDQVTQDSEVFHRDLTRGLDGRCYWRSLDELAQTPEFIEKLHREFPSAAAEWDELDAAIVDGVSRRNFLALMGASLALAGVGGAGCRARDPVEKIVPYVNQPEEIVPGKPLFFATALSVDGFAHGVLVESHEGRPTKIEGNPAHSASLGATNIFMQAAILSLYDPDRSQAVRHIDSVSTWDRFWDQLNPLLATKLKSGGAGMRILSEPITSPTTAAQIAALRARFPEAQWHQYSPIDRANVRQGANIAFGRPANVAYRFDRADVILSLDSDFLVDEPGSVRYARQFIDRRRVRRDQTEMNRLYVLESTRTITGAMADHRVPATPQQILQVASTLSALVGAQQMVPSSGSVTQPPIDWLPAIAADLRRAGKNALVIAGPTQPPTVHAACHAINTALGSANNVVYYTLPVEFDVPLDTSQSLAQLINDMNAGAVDLLLIVGGNPVYNAPADLNFLAGLQKVALRVHLSQYDDETSEQCHWHLPMTHALEQWGDARAFDGTVSIVQPLIAPLYEGRSVNEVFSLILGEIARPAYEIVKESTRERFSGEKFEPFWEQSLHDGLIASSALPAIPMRLARSGSTTAPTTAPFVAGGMQLIFRPDPSIGDGSWSNNGWLQELPKPITKITWENAALISPATAHQLGVQNSDLVDVKYRGRAVRAPVHVVPGLPDQCITLHLGYGRTRAGRVGNNAGFSAYSIRTSDAPWSGAGVEILAVGKRHDLATTQQESLMHGRDLVRVQNIESFRNRRESRAEAHPSKYPLTLFDQSSQMNKHNAWGMTIDINACIGCNACIVACQSENNIPIVGKEQVANGRVMHWLRIDTYFASEHPHAEHEFVYRDHAATNPDVYFQPVPCMHCENAPCELVCPVGATVHDAEGTNNMVYNRCIGTRYCSNNCPYKVRRFNWLEYNNVSESEKLGKNPDVTVRSRGVMEKCTYCIQRVNKARIESKKQNNPGGFVEDGGVLTACQQSCPTQAIEFGNVNDPNSKVAKLKAEPTNYGLLEELNTKPRTTYLERFKNPNPAIQG